MYVYMYMSTSICIVGYLTWLTDCCHPGRAWGPHTLPLICWFSSWYRASDRYLQRWLSPGIGNWVHSLILFPPRHWLLLLNQFSFFTASSVSLPLKSCSFLACLLCCNTVRCFILDTCETNFHHVPFSTSKSWIRSGWACEHSISVPTCHPLLCIPAI